MVDVRIKPLEWEKGVVDWARPLPGMKYVACSTTPAGSWAFWLDEAPETRAVFTSEVDAKAAAQADYERRIRSTLSDAVAEREAEPVASVAEVRADGQRLYNTVYPSDALDKFPIGTLLYTSPPTSELEALRKRVAELEGVLEPFADIADLIDAETEGMSETDELELHFHDYLMASWPVAMFRTARRVREGGKEMVEQYNCYGSDIRGGEMRPEQDGQWVRYSDYAALEAQLAERGKTEREIEYDVYSKIRLAFRRALSELPEIAPLEISRVLSSVHMRDEFINEGKRLQQAHGTDAVAPRVEQECGAGAWSFMRKGILAALEASPPAPKVTEGHPMQPVVVSDGGVHRFKSNTCVEALLSHGQKTGFGLNQLACQNHPVEDRMQLAQLIGYSVSGYGDLSYVTDEAYDAASRLSEALTAAQEAGKP